MVRRLLVVFGTAIIALGVTAGASSAGEITGNGKLLNVNGRSACAFSGQEDLQFYEDDGDTILKVPATKGDPGHAQSWGQIPKLDRDFLSTIGLHPGTACNPTRSSGEE
jgi:hypothetical protein